MTRTVSHTLYLSILQYCTKPHSSVLSYMGLLCMSAGNNWIQNWYKQVLVDSISPRLRFDFSTLCALQIIDFIVLYYCIKTAIKLDVFKPTAGCLVDAVLLAVTSREYTIAECVIYFVMQCPASMLRSPIDPASYRPHSFVMASKLHKSS